MSEQVEVPPELAKGLLMLPGTRQVSSEAMRLLAEALRDMPEETLKQAREIGRRIEAMRQAWASSPPPPA